MAWKLGIASTGLALAAISLVQAPRAMAAFPPINGTLAVRTSTIGPQFANVTTGPTVSIQAQSVLPNSLELAIAGFTGLTSGDRLFDFETNVSSTTGPPFGALATSSGSFTQNFTTTGPRWLQLTSRVRVEAPAGDPASASAIVSLGRSGQPATFSITTASGEVQVTREGAFTAGTFTVGGLVQTSAGAVPGSRFGVLDGYLLNSAIADFNNSGVVNQADFAIWSAGFGSPSGTFASGNLDGDGDSDGEDFLLWQRQFGTVVPTAVSAAAAVPEPASAALAAFALAASWRRRRRGEPTAFN